MLIPLERGGREPVFRQIVEYLRRAIGAGRLAAGARLPAIRELARSLGVNRETVAAAYRELAVRGLVESGVGRGTFVLAPGSATPLGVGGGGAERRFAPRLARAAEAAAAAGPRVDYAAPASAIHLERLVPDASLCPVDEFRRTLDRALRSQASRMLEYGDPRGDESLRRALVERFAHSGIEADADDILITAGSTQGFALAARLLCEPGDAVAVESPTYGSACTSLVAHGLRPEPVGVGRDGLDLAELDALLARGGVRLVYTMPTFHNPLGTTTSLEHRRALLELCARHGVPILEDDFEKDLRVRGRPVPPLRALDPSGLVLYLGTFSKSLFPSARVGWLLLSKRLASAGLALKRATDLATSALVQTALADFLASGAYERHLRRVRRALEERLDTAFQALERHLPDGSSFTRPDGGYVLWVTLPEAIDSLALHAAAKAAGVVYTPGQLFFPDGRRTSSLRLSLAQAEPAEIERGIRALGEVAAAALPRRRSRGAPGAGAPAVHV
jgi:GntR family transcriptional regulator/MocR family aminotransferase